jgi:NTP pyrophosphatase (non-canonical NTP hydrolase)
MGSMGLAGESSELFELFLDAQEVFLKAARTSVTAGKLVDYLKKVAHHEHKLDKDKVKKELGDLLWYMAVVAHMADLKLSDVAKANVMKLRARYGTAFDPAKSQERKAEDT